MHVYTYVCMDGRIEEVALYVICVLAGSVRHADHREVAGNMQTSRKYGSNVQMYNCYTEYASYTFSSGYMGQPGRV